jgi:hypothetical protein
LSEQLRELATTGWSGRRSRWWRRRHRRSSGRSGSSDPGSDDHRRLHRDRGLEPVAQVHEVRKELRDDDRLSIDVDACEHRRASRWQRVEQIVDPSSLGLIRTRQPVHHHEPSGRRPVREKRLDVSRRDALAQLVFRVELVAGHRRGETCRCEVAWWRLRAADGIPLYSC